ncbi:RNA-directed DNA polymerase (reversetranscriptase)-related family protein [Striga asiatica]|uniref:RNA-directed DNA polymerase (Reversetranscriptase)-related family protein n=1 Tax=Striga asiatica TaxID=4170 RepID=A0A5A7R2D7_STRAF|nr:RNA-directed DNA polymerase (reversetranscriptase)-related family protein [Striga asiatica]
MSKKIQKLDIAEGSTTADRTRRIKLRSWKLRIQCKLKHFVWKCFNGILPVNVTVKKRGIIVDVVCRRARDVWKHAPVRWDGMVTDTYRSHDLLIEFHAYEAEMTVEEHHRHHHLSFMMVKKAEVRVSSFEPEQTAIGGFA